MWTGRFRVGVGMDIKKASNHMIKMLVAQSESTLTTLHCSKVSFLHCCHMKIYNKIFTKKGCTHTCETLYI